MFTRQSSYCARQRRESRCSLRLSRYRATRVIGVAHLRAATNPGILGRVGCWTSTEVQDRTVVVLLRLRHQLVSQKAGRSSTLLVEEATALAWTGSSLSPLEGADWPSKSAVVGCDITDFASSTKY